MEYREQNFSGGAVHLDGNTYVKCSFDNTVLHYGGGPLVMESCHYNYVVWAFEGPVARAVEVIAGIYGSKPDLAVQIWRTAMFGKDDPSTIN